MWDKIDITPRQANEQQQKRIMYPNPGLMRLFFFLGFMAVSLICYTAGNSICGFGDLNHDEWNFSKVMVSIISLVLGAGGGILGAMIGISIPVKKERNNFILTCIWHYMATGGIIWGFLFMLCVQKIYGEAGIKSFLNSFPFWYLSLSILGISMITSLLIALILTYFGVVQRNKKTRLGTGILLSMPISLLFSFSQFHLLNINSSYWVFIAVVFPFLLITTSTYMINRDKTERSN